MTSTNETKEVILKRDVLGRVRVSAERREELLEEYDRSGLSGMKFAGWAGIKYTTLANWLQKRRREAKAEAGSTPTRWVEAVVKPPQEGVEPLVVELGATGSGARMRIEHKGQVNLAVELLREWSRGC